MTLFIILYYIISQLHAAHLFSDAINAFSLSNSLYTLHVSIYIVLM